MSKRIGAPKRAGRKGREKQVLISLVEYYLATGKPVGSHALQEACCSELSSATIRNYCVSLEQQGYLKQQHASGGRIPLSKAFYEYAQFCLESIEDSSEPASFLSQETLEAQGVVSFLQRSTDECSRALCAAVAISSPRFDHDMVSDLRFVFLDVRRTLCVVMTEFGLVHTEVIASEFELSQALLRKADRFAHSRLFREELEHDFLVDKELDAVKALYQEAIASYFVSYSSVSQEDVWKAGFSRLLQRPEFEDSEAFSSALGLFEDTGALRGFMRRAMTGSQLQFWMGEELRRYTTKEPNCVLAAHPYFVGERAVGAIIVIVPTRVQYKDLFETLKGAAQQISAMLTTCLMHSRISYRMPNSHPVLVSEAACSLPTSLLLE